MAFSKKCIFTGFCSSAVSKMMIYCGPTCFLYLHCGRTLVQEQNTAPALKLNAITILWFYLASYKRAHGRIWRGGASCELTPRGLFVWISLLWNLCLLQWAKLTFVGLQTRGMHANLQGDLHIYFYICILYVPRHTEELEGCCWYLSALILG